MKKHQFTYEELATIEFALFTWMDLFYKKGSLAYKQKEELLNKIINIKKEYDNGDK